MISNMVFGDTDGIHSYQKISHVAVVRDVLWLVFWLWESHIAGLDEDDWWGRNCDGLFDHGMEEIGEDGDDPLPAAVQGCKNRKSVCDFGLG